MFMGSEVWEGVGAEGPLDHLNWVVGSCLPTIARLSPLLPVDCSSLVDMEAMPEST